MKKEEEFMATSFGNYANTQYQHSQFVPQAPPQNDFESLASTTTDALNSIATNISSNSNTINSLMSTIQKQQEEINNLQMSINNVTSIPTPKTDNTSQNNNLLEKMMQAIANQNSTNTMEQLVDLLKNQQKGQGRNNNNNQRKIYYCWSCGFGTNPTHTSATCRRKVEGHIATATKDDRQGGSLRNAKKLRVKLN